MHAWHVKDALARIQLVTCASLMSAPAIIVFVAVSMSPNVMFDILTQRGPAGAWLAASAAATAAGVLVILAARPLLGLPHSSAGDTTVAFVVLAAAALTKSAVIALLVSPVSASWVLHVTSTAPVGQRTLTNLAYTLLGVGIACAVVTRGREHRERRRLLVAEQERLVDASSTMAERLREAEEELRTETHAVLDPALASVRKALESSSDEPGNDRVLESLRVAVSDVIRPMSHRYARELPVVDLPSARGSRRQAEPLGVLHAQVDVPASIRPGLILILSAATFTLIAPLAGAPRRAYLTAAVLYLVTSLCLVLIRWVWPRRWRRATGRTAIASLLLVYLVVFGATGLAFADARIWGDWQNFALMSLGYRTIISMAISMTVLVQQQQREVDRGIEAVNEALARQLAVMRREVWSIRRRMSMVLHGSVQSALISAMLLLREDTGPGQIAEVRQRLDQALAAIDLGEQAAAGVEHGLREISTLWTGVAEVRVDLAPEASVRLREQPGLSTAVIEIVREAVGNAVRHGGAREVTVQIGEVEAGLVRVHVRDDGCGLSPVAVPGLGSQMLDEVCIRWQRQELSSGVELRAVLA